MLKFCIRYVNPVKENPAQIRDVDRDFAKHPFQRHKPFCS